MFDHDKEEELKEIMEEKGWSFQGKEGSLKDLGFITEKEMKEKKRSPKA